MKSGKSFIFVRMFALLICIAMAFSCVGCKGDVTTSEVWISYWEDEVPVSDDGKESGTSSDNEDGDKNENGTGGKDSSNKGNSSKDKNGTSSNGNTSKDSTASKNSGSSKESGTTNKGDGSSNKNGVTLKRDGYTITSKGFPIVTDGKAQLHVMLPSGTYETETSGFAKEYEKMTGVKVKYSYYERGDIFTLKTTLIKSGNCPDIIFAPAVGFSNGELEYYAGQGVVANLTSYLDTWGPNMKAAIKNSAYVDINKVIGLPSTPIPEGKELAATGMDEFAMFINKSWLDNLGLDVPETTDEFYDVLDAFVNQDPDGNGKNDTYGYGLTAWNPSMWNMWGLNMSWYYLGATDENGKTDWGPLTDQYREGILFYKELWDNNLLCKEVINAATTAIQNKHLKKCGVMAGCNPTWILDESELNDWVAMATPKGENTGNYKAGIKWSTGTTGMTNGTHGFANYGVVFESCKDKELAVRWLDYFYTQDGTMLATYGPEGKAYQKKDNGYKLIKNALNLRDGQWIGAYTFPSISNPNILKNSESEMTAIEKAQTKYDKEYESASRVTKYSYQFISEFRTYDEIQLQDDWKLPSCEWGYEAIQGKVNIQTEWNAYVGKHSTSRQKLKDLYDNKLFARVYG